MTNKTVYSKFANIWRQTRYSARPSKSELEIINQIVKKIKPRTIAVLGATPEFRDLGLRHSSDVVALDINPKMIREMSQLMRHKEKGKKVICDWTNIKLPDQSVDLVLSEQSLNIIPTKEWSKVLSEVRRILKPAGIFIAKIQIYQPDGRILNLDHLVSKLETGQIGISDFSSFLKYLPESTAYNRKNYVLSLKKHASLKDKLYQEGKISSKNSKIYERVFGSIFRHGLDLYVMPKDLTNKELKEFFTIQGEKYGQDFISCKFTPIYILRKK